jgi:hypothetical protein
MEQGYYSKDRAGYYREGFLAHGSISSKVFYTTWHWGTLMSAFGGIADIGRNLARDGLSAYDPSATLAVHCGNGFDAGFSPY